MVCVLIQHFQSFDGGLQSIRRILETKFKISLYFLFAKVDLTSSILSPNLLILGSGDIEYP
jgi:hypothetical protein